MSNRTGSIQGRSTVGVHMGSILLRASSTYPTILEVILEQIQNAIDANATQVWVNINQKSRSISIRDNGDGSSQSHFEKALSLVGQTIKPTNKLGRFGLGLCSPLGKCERHTFTSTTRRDPSGYLEWTFETPKIVGMKAVSVPIRNRPDLLFSRKKDKGVAWRTEIRIEKYTSDRFVQKMTMDSLCEGVQKYAKSMRRKDVVVLVSLSPPNGDKEVREIRAEDFQGSPLKVQTIKNPEGGETHFRLFLTKASSKGRKGKVWVGEKRNDFRINFSTFVRTLPEATQLSDEAIQALSSGIFEGEILNTKVQLHANRRGFELNDTLLGFCLAIEDWFDQFGREHFNETRKVRREERYQNLGIRSMRAIEALAKSPLGQHILKAIESFKVGTVGTGHFPRRGRLSEKSGLSVTIPSDKSQGGNSPGGESTGEHTGHKPFVVLGPRGTQRKLVRSNSLGLSMAHEPLPGDKLWELDSETGTVILNIKHPLWVECEERGDRVLMRFQEYLVVHALTVETMPEDWKEIVRTGIDEATPSYAFMLIHGDVLSGRIPTRKVTKAKPKASPKKLVLNKRASQ